MIRILSDSTCDLPPELLAQHHITVLPHIIVWGEEQLRDRVDIQVEEFYRRLEQDPRHPTTSAIPEIAFHQAYQRLQDEGADEIIALIVGADYSSAYHNALISARQAAVKVHVVDTKTTCAGLGWMVLAAARLCADGAGVEEILARVEELRQKMYLYVCLDTLKYLEKGGRIGKAARLVGTLLNIKPLIEVDSRKGEVLDFGTVRTHKRAVEALYRRFFQSVDPTRPFRVSVMHGKAPEEAALLVERIRSEYEPLELLSHITGPALGIHTGPRALALIGYNE